MRSHIATYSDTVCYLKIACDFTPCLHSIEDTIIGYNIGQSGNVLGISLG